MMQEPIHGYIPTTPPLRVRIKPTKSKKKLSRTTKEQRLEFSSKYGSIRNDNQNEINECDNQVEHYNYHEAATRIQYAWRCHYARGLKIKLQAQIGRPAQLQLHEIQLSEKWLRLGSYCIITILRRPYGPLMYQYKTDISKDKKINHEPFFVPIMSTKYDIIVTVIAEPSRLQYPIFLGQAVLHVDDAWANIGSSRIRQVPFQTYQFPVDIQLQNVERLLEGHVKLSLVSLNSSISSYSGPFYVRPTNVSKTLASVRHRVGKFYMRNGMSYESSLSWCRQTDIREWGVLTETFLSIYHQGALYPYKHFDLRKIQLIEENESINNKFSLKIYHDGMIHQFTIESKAEYRQWIYRIDSNRRKLLVP